MNRFRSLALVLVASAAIVSSSSRVVGQGTIAGGVVGTPAGLESTYSCGDVPTHHPPPLTDNAVLLITGDVLWVLNADLLGTVHLLDPVTLTETAIFNPLDSLVRDVGGLITARGLPSGGATLATGQAYLTRFDLPRLLRVDLGTYDQSEIDLSMFADSDGIPEMDQMFDDGQFLYVAIDRLDRAHGMNPAGGSELAVLSLATGTVIDMDASVPGVQGIPLIAQHPYSEINVRDVGGIERAYFSAVGVLGVPDGVVIELDVNDPASQTAILTEAAAGGDILDVEIVSDSRGYAIVSIAGTKALIAFNPQTGEVVGGPLKTGSGLGDLEPMQSALVLSDRTPGQAGVSCFDLATGEQISGPIDLGSPAYDVIVYMIPASSVGRVSAPASLGRIFPNPFKPEASIPFTLTEAGHTTLTIHDVNGRLVATLFDGVAETGTHVAHWDGRTQQGTPAPSGVYFVRLLADGVHTSPKLVLLK